MLEFSVQEAAAEREIFVYYRKHVLGKDTTTWDERKRTTRRLWAIEQILESEPCPPNPVQGLVQVVMGFMSVEMLLPDFVQKISEMIRSSLGRAMFVHFWAGEEQLHSLALQMWLERVGALSVDGVIEFYQRCVKVPWNPTLTNPDFACPKYGAAYTMLQELYTSIGYRQLARYAERVGQLALTRICERLASEEASHHAFYMGICQILMKYWPREMAEKIHLAYRDFRMPGDFGQLPNYRRWSITAIREGVMPGRKEHRADDRLVSPEEGEQLRVREVCWESFRRQVAKAFQRLHLEVPRNLTGPDVSFAEAV